MRQQPTPESLLRFIAKIADTGKLQLSGVLETTAKLLDAVVDFAPGQLPGTQRCKVCDRSWPDAEKPQHSSRCPILELEEEIQKVTITIK